MRNLIFCLLIFFSCKSEKRYHDIFTLDKSDFEKEVLVWQAQWNDTFKNPETSPLKKKDRKTFKELSFFEPDSSFCIMAFLDRIKDTDTINLATSTGDKRQKIEAGVLVFRLGEAAHKLFVYAEVNGFDGKPGEELFLLFTDLSNGKTTYGGGRYIDLELPEGDSLLLDFNKAYNPYCAYNSNYSCPLVPRKNHLNIEIAAGVRKFEKR